VRLEDLVSGQAHSRRPAIVDRGSTSTHSAWLEAAARVAGGLEARGLRAGERIAVWLPNSYSALVLELAAALSGLAVVGVPPGARLGELSAVRETTRPAALFTPLPSLPPEAETVFGPDIAAGRTLHVAVPEAADGHGAGAWVDLLASAPGTRRGSEGDPLYVFATSGTTHSPKMVVHSQDEIAWRAAAAARALALGPEDVMLCVLPFSGVFGHTALWAAVAAGTPVALEASFEAHQCARAIEREGVTCLFGSDVLLRRLLALPDAEHRLASLRWAGFAAFGGPARDLVEEAMARLSLPVFQVYGSSEAQALTAMRAPGDPPALRALAGGGLVDPDMEARVVDPQTLAPLPIGRAGELELRGRSLFRAYLGNAAATAAAWHDGFYRTGDLARLDQAGRLTFESRLADSLRLGGYLVDPAEIEEVLCQHPAVAQAQVVSGAGPGERDVAVAFVRARDNAAVANDDLRAWCEARLARHKVPRRFVPLDAFPVAHGPNGDKVQRHVLRAWARSGGPDSRGV
jgi:acyl-CoA synthetase (AMP-forming)/AMP-acid ligase II